MAEDRNIRWQAGVVGRPDRWQALGLRGATVWLTGLSGSGKSTLAEELERVLVARKVACYRLDGDNLRHGLNRDLGFSPEDRKENVRRAGEAALLFADFGAVAIVGLISPYAADRDEVRRRHEEASIPFFEVHVDTPLQVCEARDPKGLYAKARAGALKGLTGVDAPYEAPTAPALRLGNATIPEDTAAIIGMLERAEVLG